LVHASKVLVSAVIELVKLNTATHELLITAKKMVDASQAAPV
jgi:hypothetical protein